MSFLNENTAVGLRNGPNAFQAGESDTDNGTSPETGTLLPWYLDPTISYMDYVSYIGIELDSGIVVHWPLCQIAQPIDTLGSQSVADASLSANINGVNLVSQGDFEGVIQRMATSRYRFCLKGWARRAGYQIPMPILKIVAGVLAIPDDDPPQKAHNIIIANYSGIPIWFARWEAWYTVAVPPRKAQDPPANLAEFINASVPLPKGIQTPISIPDEDSFRNSPIRRGG